MCVCVCYVCNAFGLCFTATLDMICWPPSVVCQDLRRSSGLVEGCVSLVSWPSVCQGLVVELVFSGSRPHDVSSCNY